MNEHDVIHLYEARQAYWWEQFTALPPLGQGMSSSQGGLLAHTTALLDVVEAAVEKGLDFDMSESAWGEAGFRRVTLPW